MFQVEHFDDGRRIRVSEDGDEIVVGQVVGVNLKSPYPRLVIEDERGHEWTVPPLISEEHDAAVTDELRQLRTFRVSATAELRAAREVVKAARAYQGVLNGAFDAALDAYDKVTGEASR